MKHVVVAGEAIFGPFATPQLAEQFAALSGFADYLMTPIISEQDEIACQLEIEAYMTAEFLTDEEIERMYQADRTEVYK